ncbi:uncharacterized domain 1-containing protein [Filimonas lacunae]|uniref:Uncharacterized domain 1-containing protein n=1 Tax=Filimonas lacunae TaxID=477680 RepID=A0A173MEE1_9BACT|nr:acyl-CoA thioesterase [Filimonas lacunae]BAV05887.1 acyl CoA thioester hydrolase family protein [Filimonas lacunae]SIT34567.1 uncharacterized domain 1-containing protein [Filimonas lacunae]
MDNFKPVSDSATVIAELMIPSYSNFGGKIHGGHILSLMDKTAYVCAVKHAGAYCVTASIETVDFLAPAEVGELVTLYASVNYVGKSSIVVGIRVMAENFKTQVVKHTNTSYFTMVAMDEDHKPTPVPGLLLTNHNEVRRFYEALHKKELKKYYRNEEVRIKSEVEQKEMMEVIKNERCLVQLAE